MGDKRLAKKVILLRRGKETTHKIEVFDGRLFPGKTFTSLLGEPLPEERYDRFRLRINGKWFPARQKLLYSREELNKVLTTLVGE